MKNKIIALAATFFVFSEGKACADYSPDTDYFNLFTQTIIRDKAYIPFLLTYGSGFYEDGEKRMIPDENIFTWQKFFGNKLNYKETEFLVNHMPMADLNAFKKGSNANPILQKLGSFQNYQEGIDYLIEAKYLEPFMRINYVEDPNSFYYRQDTDAKDATQLDYHKTVSALVSLYSSVSNPEIKQRYGYQLVRFNHYNRNYEQAMDAFETFVKPINLKGAPYYLALDQYAGAQRGLNMGEEANWNFFQVFQKLNTRKESAYVSMKLSDSAAFNNILKRSSSPEEKNMAYFLLGYNDYNNPLQVMEKMYEINPDSEILKVLATRSINQLERNYLPAYIYPDRNSDETAKRTVNPEKTNVENSETEKESTSFWDKIVNFFQGLFGKKEQSTQNSEKKNDQSDKELLNNPYRIPALNNEEKNSESKKYLEDFEKFTEKTKAKSKDEFWQIAEAYVKFIKKDYQESSEVLNSIKTQNQEYLQQIERMKILNEITSEPRITRDFEDVIMQKYSSVFEQKPDEDSTEYYYYQKPETSEFIVDVLANRYFLQGEEGKSFLLNNTISDLQYNPDIDLTKKVEEFYQKKNKSKLEQKILARGNDMKNPLAFFNTIYGDREMRTANFDKAKQFYEKAVEFDGVPRFTYDYTQTHSVKTPVEYDRSYDGFHNISSLIFGHNVWESFQSPKETSMAAEDLSGYPFLKPNMNKLEIANAVIQLKKTGNGNSAEAAKANQLIGNLLYNTSSLGYFREVFVLDVDNSNGPKFHFGSEKPVFSYYYKDFGWNSYAQPDNFDHAINYYEKALKTTASEENKARILFQLASAEQGKYYQWESKQPSVDYSEDNWQQKMDEKQRSFDLMKNQKFRKYFNLLKSQYATTQTAQNLRGSCSYFDYFMKK